MACRAWMTSNHNTHMQTHTADARDRVGTTASGWRESARVTSWSHMQTDRYALWRRRTRPITQARLRLCFTQSHVFVTEYGQKRISRNLTIIPPARTFRWTENKASSYTCTCTYIHTAYYTSHPQHTLWRQRNTKRRLQSCCDAPTPTDTSTAECIEVKMWSVSSARLRLHWASFMQEKEH